MDYDYKKRDGEIFVIFIEEELYRYLEMLLSNFTNIKQIRECCAVNVFLSSSWSAT